MSWEQIGPREHRFVLGAHPGPVISIGLTPNLYADEDDGMPPNKNWAMSAEGIGVGYHELSTVDLDAAKLEALAYTRERVCAMMVLCNDHARDVIVAAGNWSKTRRRLSDESASKVVPDLARCEMELVAALAKIGR